MNKLIKILKTYLKACILMLPAVLVGQFVGTMIIYYNYGYTPIHFPKYDSLIIYTLLFGLYKYFCLHEIIKTICIQDESDFRKNLNIALSKLTMIIISDEKNILIIKHNHIIDNILCNTSTLTVNLYNDKAVLKGSRDDIKYVFANLKQTE